MSEQSLAVLIFMVTALAFGWLGFNQPSWSRSYTTAFRYWAALVAHIALYIGGLLLCALVLRKVFHAFGMERRELAILSLLAAFVILAIVRAVPALVHGPRRMLHRAAGIPWVALRQADCLADASYVRKAAVEQEARSLLRNRGIDAECDWLPAATQVHEQLLNATALFIQLRDWEGQRQYAAFVSEARNEFDRLRQEFDRVSFRFARAVGNVERLGKIRYACTHHTADAPVEIDADFRKLVKSMVADVSEDVGVFYRDACRLVSRGVMVTRPTRGGRARSFAWMGFHKAHQESQLGVGVLLHAALLLYVGIWLFFQVLPADENALSAHERISVITLIVLGSLAAAIVPKLHWGFANAGLRDRTPASFVVGAGLAAVLFAVIVNLLAGMMLLGGLDGAAQRLGDGAPYLHSAFMTAATTAWLVQDHRWRNVPSHRRRRMLDAVTLGGVWIVSSMIAQYIRVTMGEAPPEPQVLGMMIVLAFVLGAVIGYSIPGSVRTDLVAPTASPAAKAATEFMLGAVARHTAPARPAA